MKLLIINPNTTAALTDKIAGIARGAAAPGTEIIAATAPFGASYISTPEESAVAVDAVLEVIAGHEGAPYDPPVMRTDEVALLQFTGGTTGVPKAAILTHGNISASVQTYNYGSEGEPTGEPGMPGMLFAPLFHIMGWPPSAAIRSNTVWLVLTSATIGAPGRALTTSSANKPSN